MALNSNALTTVDAFMAYAGRTASPRELLSVYHDGSDSVATATVEVTSSTVELVTDVGGTDSLGLSSYSTMTALVAAINALTGSGKTGWVAELTEGGGGSDPTDLDTAAATNALLPVNAVFLAGKDLVAIEQAINASSDVIQSYTGRIFASNEYAHLYSGTGRKNLVLRHRPVISLNQVAIGRKEVMSIKNTNTDNQAAWVKVTSTGVQLIIEGDTDSSPEATFGLYPTMQDIIDFANAASAVGWSATLTNSNAGGWDSEDLLQTGPMDALGVGATLAAAEESVSEVDVQKDTGVLWLRGATGWGAGDGFGQIPFHQSLYPLSASETPPLWPKGIHNIYVRYTAGYSTIPADIVQACHEVAQNFLSMGPRDTGLASEQVEGYSFQQGDGPFNEMIKRRLYRYRDVVANLQFVEA